MLCAAIHQRSHEPADLWGSMSDDPVDEIEKLIGRVGLKDREAFSSLYDATCGKLLAVCMRVLRNRAAAEDALQETFVKVWRNAGSYRITGHSPMTWLITIARNTAIDRLRTRKMDRDIADYDERLPSSSPSPEDAAIASSEARRIVRCMEELEPDRRAAVSGAYLEGKSYKELSEKYDVPLNTMRTWLRRSLQVLREGMAR